MCLCAPHQFHDFRLERGINRESLPVGMTFFTFPRSKKASSLAKNRWKRRHIPKLDGSVEHDFRPSRRDHVIAVCVAPATPKEAFLVQSFEHIQFDFRSETGP